ncbi:MAG: carboxylating nicotinate-nucleotide diphosphorylase [Acidobacteriota bacterium]|nr:carboxylating nicotinate-nucleotide diphosphorylase [Acidobacteriota bacterium]HPN16324.1 carboxylating nicotinate-nucleotide diphosphorylase [Candidatus Aminicenantes bacterium]
MKTLDVQEAIDRALAEDLPAGDVTTAAIVPPDLKAAAVLLAKEDGVLAGIDVFVRVFKTLDPKVAVRSKLRDGSPFRPGQVLGEISGPAAVLLRGERTALNFVQRLSGIATTTQSYVRAVAGTGVRVLDTRKTTPGLRDLEKYAVRRGGGVNHRRDLSSMVLVKDNHLAVAGGVGPAVAAVRAAWGRRFRLEVEAATAAEAMEAAAAGADWVMLDNMTIPEMKKTVRLLRGRVKIEASGNVCLDNIRQIAETGVDFISIGRLTHSARAVDLSLEIKTKRRR